jgi:NADH-quinone oxidoreductase subunit H
VTPALPLAGVDIAAALETLWSMSAVRALVWAHIVVLVVITPVGLLSIWVERRLSGLMQARIGPNRVGPQGLLQTLADGVKLLNKEDLIPAGADRFFFQLAPVVVFIAAFGMFVILPYGPDWIPANIAVGILFALAIGSLEAVGVIMAGWASDNKWALLGTMRVAAQVVSYEVPLGLAALVPVLSYGTLDVQEIVRQQQGWPLGLLYCFPANLVAFVVFFVAALANLKRAPFDLPEAESELVAGFHTEYSGMRFSIFFLAEYAAMFVMSGVAAVLWLGGWGLPFTDLAKWDNFWLRNLVGAAVIMGKASLLVGVMMWLRWTLPRLRVDQVMNLCYKFLLPLSLGALVWAAAVLVFVPALGGW